MIRKLLVLIFLFLLSCGSETRNTDEIIIALDSEPQRINPLFLTDLNSHMVSNLIFRGLVSIDESGNPKPELAKSWSIKDGGREIIFHLREDVYWHDGSKFKAQDVLFTYKLLTSQDIPSPRKGVLGPVEEIKILNDYKIVVRYSEPYGSAIESWSIGILPKHLGEKVLDPSFDKNPTGTGPWRVIKWQKGQFIVFEAFDKFYDGMPKIRKIILKFIPDQTTKYLEMKAGRVDVGELPSYVKIYELEEKFNQYKADSFRYVCLGFNLLNPLFQDEKIRVAIAYLINRNELIKAVLNGKGTVSLGPYPRGVWYYNNEIKPYPYNPKKGKEILKDVGVENLKFKISINIENKELLKTAQFIQQALKDVGVQTEIRVFDWQTLRHRILEEKNFDAVVLSRAYLWDPDIYDLWHSSKAERGGWNLFSFKDKEVDSLLETGRKTVDTKVRAEIYRKVHKLLYEKQACVFLYETPLIFYANKKIKGIKANPQGMLYGVEKWFLKD